MSVFNLIKDRLSSGHVISGSSADSTTSGGFAMVHDSEMRSEAGDSALLTTVSQGGHGQLITTTSTARASGGTRLVADNTSQSSGTHSSMPPLTNTSTSPTARTSPYLTTTPYDQRGGLRGGQGYQTSLQPSTTEVNRMDNLRRLHRQPTGAAEHTPAAHVCTRGRTFP